MNTTKPHKGTTMKPKGACRDHAATDNAAKGLRKPSKANPKPKSSR